MNLIFFSSFVLERVGFGVSESLRATLFAASFPFAVQLMVQPLSYLIMDSLGRRRSLLTFLPLEVAALFLIALSNYISSSDTKWLTLFALVMFFTCNGIGVQNTVYVLKG